MSSISFLQEPTELAELNEWVKNRSFAQSRFTFSEQSVLAELWQSGQEIRLREDSRFLEVVIDKQTYWHLRTERLANTELYNLMLDGLWDGKDLLLTLANLDQNSKSKIVFNVFCPEDSRFKLEQNPNVAFGLTLITTPVIELTNEQQQALAQIILTLQKINRLWTTHELLNELEQMLNLTLAELRDWLLHNSDWLRVGFDYWIAREHRPILAYPTQRYAVLPIRGSLTFVETSPDLVEIEPSHPTNFKQSHEVEVVSLSWQVTLRTYQLNEGVLSVPPKARILYPHALKLAELVALQGLWYADGTDIIVWLDRSKHKFFGPNLQEKLELLEAGVILEIKWIHNNIVFTQIGEDTNVAEEEARLIDLESLNETRFIKLESYRTSLRSILADNAQKFITLYKELCKHQQHKVNKNTVRSVLASSPEFNFDHIRKNWYLNIEVTSDKGAKLLRQATLLAQQTVRHQEINILNLTQRVRIESDKLKTFEIEFLRW